MPAPFYLAAGDNTPEADDGTLLTASGSAADLAKQMQRAADERAGLTAGLKAIQAFSAGDVDRLRQQGPMTSIAGRTLPSTDPIRVFVGFRPDKMNALSANDVARNLDRVQTFVGDASKRYGLDPNLLNAVIVQESKGMQNAVSGTGALGISQLMEAVYGAKSQFKQGINPFDPQAAIDRQAAQLSILQKQFGPGDRMLAAYNQGSGTLSHAVAKGGGQWLRYMPVEAKNYVAEISKIMGGQKRIPGYFGTPP